MPDRALDRHDQRSLGAHADLDEFACVHRLFASLSRVLAYTIVSKLI
jgi:hypothetical protein